MTKSIILSGVGGFVRIIISLFTMAWMCLILLNMHVFFKFGSDNVLINVGCDDMYHVAFFC